ncbi:hypothetical protein POJ06DRAFT_268944 [Lipomyces tetrasporus]|uniref:Uncharacterized protein n=1 Tax=Lipomyces tetrasporus TaxID=54092 RepID=A0AAD7QSD2_9ASCO|nr:uncharacterized protein POJ06DRAFT_268944 [Lipomyces tetrasporus]KAJ8100071.1 hypothetical protein POJ06DRAFT_268944 [Lipomyces tetrasporus]
MAPKSLDSTLVPEIEPKQPRHVTSSQKQGKFDSSLLKTNVGEPNYEDNAYGAGTKRSKMIWIMTIVAFVCIVGLGISLYRSPSSPAPTKSTTPSTSTSTFNAPTATSTSMSTLVMSTATSTSLSLIAETYVFLIIVCMAFNLQL